MESIFKNSRLMLHEIIESKDSDWVNFDMFEEEKKTDFIKLLKPN